ncbi:CHAT domain-containing protein [Pseudonocardia charpentierae]|uniref:CHAT domain-containing protein n=1 Tax=Pseudonocardia charpentierae TaxID=3075545 RepID=A0ABU2NIX3_9PSEU|nr:CHAT domain-containing protein [Pseudonocardia sp. DSM 45834]MDT0353368.1 CHAT domain-containing protein [Pseudonocardia sp. DSM 45834]
MVATIQRKFGQRVLSLAPNAGYVLDGTTNGPDSELRVLDLSGALQASCSVPGRLVKAELAPDADAVLVLTEDDKKRRRVLMLRLDLAEGLLVGNEPDCPAAAAPDDVAWLPDGCAFVVGDRGDYAAFAIARRLGEPWSEVNLPAAFHGGVWEVHCESDCLVLTTVLDGKRDDSGEIIDRQRSYVSTWAVTPDGPTPLVADRPMLAVPGIEGYLASADGRHLSRHFSDEATGSRTSVWAAGSPPRQFDIPGVLNLAIGRDCLAASGPRNLIHVYRLTSEGPVSWGPGWRLGVYDLLEEVFFANGREATYMVVSFSHRTQVLQLNDPDILDTYVGNATRRQAAVRALGKRQRADAVPHLTRLVPLHWNVDVPAVAWALGLIGTDEAVDGLLAMDPDVPEVQEALRMIDASQAQAAVRRGLAGDSREALRGATALLVRRPDVPATAELCTLLADGEPRIRAMAAEALAARADPAALPALIAALSDSNEATVRHASTAVLAVDAEQVLEVVQSWLARRRRKPLRDAAAVLVRRPDVPATVELRTLLADRDAGIRAMAAEALAGRADPAALPDLIAALADSDKRTAQHAWTGILAAMPAASLTDGPTAHGTVEAAIRFAAYVRRTGCSDTTHVTAPEGGRLLRAIAAALVDDEQSADRVLNALKDLGHSDRHAPTAMTISLLAAESLVERAHREKAISFFSQAAEQAALVGSAEVEWRARAAIGDALAASRRWRQAHLHYSAAERVIDRMWAALLGDLDDRNFFRDKAHLYEQAMLCRLRLGSTASALETLERAKTRFLGDLIARRHARPVHGLARVDEEFWRATGRRRPVVFSRNSDSVSEGDDLEIIDVALGEPANDDGVLPAALAELADTTNDTYQAMMMALDLWSVVAMLQRGEYEDERADAVRDVLLEVDAAMAELRAAADEVPRTDGRAAARRYDQVATALDDLRQRDPAASDDGSAEPGWALRELRGWVVPYLDGAQEYVPLVEALQEAARFPAGRTHVRAVRGSETAERVVLSQRRNGPLPVFTAATPSDEQAADGDIHPTATSALSVVTIARWRYVRQIARGETVGVREAAGLLAGWPGTALLEYAVTKSGAVVYVMVPDAVVDSEPLPDLSGWYGPAVFTISDVTSQDLENRIYGPRGWMKRYEGRRSDPVAWQEATDQLLQWLYGELFEPIRRWLLDRDIRRLLVVPHRGLHLLPLNAWFTTRWGRRSYVGDTFDVSFSPSLTLLDICRNRIDEATQAGSGGRLPLALLDPTSNLPYTRLDALAIRPEPSPTDILAGSDATLGRWAERAANADPCHYAGHAEYLRADPLGSRVELRDGALTLGRMFDGEVPVAPGATVVLSGCETAMTDYGDVADEYLGIASGFLFAGSAAVLSTQWAVAEGAAALLIAGYYANLRRTDPSAALAIAQRRLRRASRRDLIRLLDNTRDLDRLGLLGARTRAHLEDARQGARQVRLDYSHPVFWAAYTITGLHARSSPNS